MDCYVGEKFHKSCNINAYIGNKQDHTRITFCNKMYPVEGGFKGAGWKRLKDEFFNAARAGGFKLYSNGTVAQKSVTTQMIVLKCCQGRKRVETYNTKERVFREEFVTNFKLGTRPNMANH